MRKNFVVAALIISSQLHAQTFKQKKTDSTITVHEPHYASALDPVVITANKFPEKQSQTGKVITVIDKSTIEKLGGHTVGELLNTVAGVTVNGANNTLGTNQRISIRGSSDGNVLLLMDGIPVNDPSVISNYFDLNFINTSQIERIEVLKGGQSTLYGSDAVSGVINIITKKNENKKFVPYASLNAGSYSTFNENIGARGQTKAITYNTSFTNISSQGFSSAYDSTGNKNFDKDGYHQFMVRADLGWKLTSNLQWNFFGNYSRYKAGIDAGAFTDDKDFTATNKNRQTGSGIYWKQNNGALHLNYQYNYVNRFYLDDSVDRTSFSYYSKSTYIGRTHFAELYENYKWNHVELLVGADYRRYNTNQVYQSISMFGPYNSQLNDTLAKMWQWSGYASVVYTHHNANIAMGGRINHHNVYGNNATYTFNPFYLIHQKTKLFINISSAFKTPGLFQLFDQFSGNQKLGPEKSNSLEGGAEIFAVSAIRFRVTGFYRKTKNAIQYIITNPQTFEGRYYNTSEQKNYGVEVELNYATAKWNIASNYAYTKGKVSSGYSASGDRLAKDTTYNNLYRVPVNAFNVLATYHFTNKISASTLFKYVGKRLEPVYASVPKQLNDYFTIDCAGQYSFSQNIKAFVDVKNITNKKYFDVLGYNSRRFNFTAGVQLNF